MKALTQLNNIERAQLLANLLPATIPAFLDYAKTVCTQILADPQKLKEEWKPNPFLSADHWLDFAQYTQDAINTQGKKLYKSTAFATTLFDGYNAILLAHFVLDYSQQLPPASKFRLLAEFLFDED